MKAKQDFSDEYLASCKDMSKAQIIEFLNNFMLVHTRKKDPTKLISIKIKESLLTSFRQKSETMGVPYQTQIKKLMKDWL